MCLNVSILYSLVQVALMSGVPAVVRVLGSGAGAVVAPALNFLSALSVHNDNILALMDVRVAHVPPPPPPPISLFQGVAVSVSHLDLCCFPSFALLLPLPLPLPPLP